MKVLIIEDDLQIVDAVSIAFQLRWPEAKVISTYQGEEGVALVESENPDVVILDLGLPDTTGFDVLKQIRLFSDVPIIILTVRSDEADIVKGLEWGADDYMVKPFRQLELLARIAALLRRKESLADDAPLVYGQWRFEPSAGQLYHGEKEIALTPTESAILRRLMINAGRVATYSSLAEAVWGTDFPDSPNALRVHVRRLRQKIEVDPSNPQVILTKAGAGYLLAKPD